MDNELQREKISKLELSIDDFLNHIQFEKRLSNNTKSSYQNDLKHYRLFLKDKNILSAEDISKSDIEKYLETLKKDDVKTSSIARKLTTIKAFHNYLFQKQILNVDVSETIERPKLRKKLPNVLTVDEVDKLLNIECKTKFDYRNKSMLELMYGTGLRISELLDLKLTDFDLEIRGQHWNNLNCHILKGYPELLLCYSSEIVNNTITTQNFYNSSKIGFNTTHIQAKNGFGFRVADILASSSCLVTEYSSDLFKLGFDIPTYKTPSEAKSLCEEILKNENYRADIVDKCNAIINKKHRFKNILCFRAIPFITKKAK